MNLKPPLLGINEDSVVTNAWDNPIITRQLHNSHVETLTAICAKRFEWDFVDGIRGGGSDDRYKADRGVAGHAAVSKIITGEARERKFIDILADEWVSTVSPSLKEIDKEKESLLYAAWAQDVLAANTWLQTRLDISQLHSEKPFVIPELSDIIAGIPRGWSYAGRMDIVSFTSNGLADIFDLKFRDRVKTEDNKKSSQPMSYGLAAQYYGFQPSFTFLEVVRGNVVEQRIDLSPSRIEFFSQRIRQSIEMIESGFFPMHTGGWWCSAKYCKAFGECRGKYERE